MSSTATVDRFGQPPRTPAGSWGIERRASSLLDGVDLRVTFSSMSSQTRRLLAMADQWKRDPLPLSTDGALPPSYRPKQQPSLAQRLTEADIQTLITRDRNGVTGRELADYYGCSLSTVKRLLRARRVRVNK